MIPTWDDDDEAAQPLQISNEDSDDFAISSGDDEEDGFHWDDDIDAPARDDWDESDFGPDEDGQDGEIPDSDEADFDSKDWGNSDFSSRPDKAQARWQHRVKDSRVAD